MVPFQKQDPKDVKKVVKAVLLWGALRIGVLETLFTLGFLLIILFYSVNSVFYFVFILLTAHSLLYDSSNIQTI